MRALRLYAAVAVLAAAALPAGAADPPKAAVTVPGADAKPVTPAAAGEVVCPPGRFVPLVQQAAGPLAFDPSDPAAVGSAVLLPAGAVLHGTRFDESAARLHTFDRPAYVLVPAADVTVSVWANGADGKPPEKVQAVRIKAGQGPKPPPDKPDPPKPDEPADPLLDQVRPVYGADGSATKVADAKALAATYRELAKQAVPAAATAGQLADIVLRSRIAAVGDRLQPVREIFGREFEAIVPTDPATALTAAHKAAAVKEFTRYAAVLERLVGQ